MIKKEISYSEALNNLAAHCSVAERCKEDLYRKMERWELEEQEKDKIIAFLVKENFLNEDRYARAYVNDKYKFAKWGKKKIVQGMLMKGVERESMQEGLNAIEYDVYLDNLKDILTAKQRTVKAKDEYDMKSKMIRFAMGRGFDYSDIIKVMPNLEVE